ncbi:unnamed protein product [Ectocarpus sp. 6 AP-2014]
MQATIRTTHLSAFAVVLVCIFPLIRNVDDLFSISKELIIVTAAVVILAIEQNVVDKWGGVYERRWIDKNVSILFVAVLFGVSIVDPLRRLAFDPLAATQHNHANRILLSHTEPHNSVRRELGFSSVIGSGSQRTRGDSEEEARLEEGQREGVPGKDTTTAAGGDGDIGDVATSAAIGRGATTASTADADGAVAPCTLNEREPTNSSVVAEGSSSVSNDNSTRGRRGAFKRVQRARGSGRDRGGSSRSRSDREEMEVWDFERIASTPLLAAAFEDYSKRALCHESVLFLSEVSRYQNNNYPMPTRASSASSPITQFGSFCFITDTFIKAGSPEEVNISEKGKRLILDLYNNGEELFDDVSEEERRMTFSRAYRDVKNMLEANLLLRFLNTDRFKNVRVQSENMKAMMGSPPPQAGEY